MKGPRAIDPKATGPILQCNELVFAVFVNEAHQRVGERRGRDVWVAPRPPSWGTANVGYRTFVCGARYSSGRPLQSFCFIARCPACPWTDYSLRAG